MRRLKFWLLKIVPQVFLSVGELLPSSTGDSMAFHATEARLVPSVLGSFWLWRQKAISHELLRRFFKISLIVSCVYIMHYDHTIHSYPFKNNSSKFHWNFHTHIQCILIIFTPSLFQLPVGLPAHTKRISLSTSCLLKIYIFQPVHPIKGSYSYPLGHGQPTNISKEKWPSSPISHQLPSAP